MSGQLKSFLVPILVMIFLVAWISACAAGIAMWNIQRKDGRSMNDLLRDFLRNPNEPPIGNKTCVYTFVSGWVIGVGSLLLVVLLE